MRRLVRLTVVILSAAVVLAGTVAGLAVVSAGAISHAASAQGVPLAPLSAPPEEGSTVYADDGTTVLAVLHASANRKPIPISQEPQVLINAVLDTEDARFFQHGGFDIPSTVRALASDSSANGGLQGGSTITQQLVKNTYLSSVRTLSRKVKEAVLADRLQQKYTKKQILQAYLNTIYLGNGAYGVEAAAEEYWNEPAGALTVPQAALLAGIIQDPSGYDPLLEPAAARNRRAVVLSRMVHYGHITQAEADAANAVPLPTTVIPTAVSSADTIDDYYVQQVQTQLLAAGSPLGDNYNERYNALFEGGLKIYTDLDPRLQTLAEQKAAADTPKNSKGFIEAMAVVDPTSGRVRAMVGGLGFNQSKYDIVTDGLRQPGSGFKLFTLLAALQAGYSINDTVDSSSPCAIDFPGDHDLVKHPAHNDEGNSTGVISVTQATALSVNCAYIRIAHEVGLDNVISMAHNLGITANLLPYPSIVIGSEAVHPLDMAGAYAAVADDGVYHKPTFIDHIVDNSGATIYQGADSGHRVLSPQTTREAVEALQAVVQYGTGTAAGLSGRQVAGKTGTTENSVDAWFNGFTPQLEATVWMGNSADEVPMFDVGGYGEVFGGDFPARTWHDFMQAALTGAPVLAFPALTGGAPAGKFITSPALVRDDHSDHNHPVAPKPTTTTTAPAAGTHPTTPGATTGPPTTSATVTPTPTTGPAG